VTRLYAWWRVLILYEKRWLVLGYIRESADLRDRITVFCLYFYVIQLLRIVVVAVHYQKVRGNFSII